MKQYGIYEVKKAENAYKEHYNVTELPYALFAQNVSVIPMGSMQAWILVDRFGNRWLQSYNTIVSVKWADTGDFERLGRWSVTTSRQQTRFEKEA
ncbi:MAG: hypothetical protein J6T54_12450 [Fibrobacter sp.]|nr:hypothetical protein [Fibrobacter sp.]